MSAERDALSKQISIRLSEDDLDRLEALTARVPVATRNSIARHAMQLGFALLEEDPSRVLQQPLPKRGRKAKR